MDERRAKYEDELAEEFRPAPVEVDSIPPGPEAYNWTDVGTTETPAKRGRGRPRKDPNAPTPARVSKPRATTRGRSLKEEISATLFMFNLIFAFMPEPWKSDALDPMEIMLLSEALDDAARADARLHKYLTTIVVSGGSMANLVMVGAMIAGRRLARHGLVPADVDDGLGTLLAAKAGQDVPANATP